MKKIKIPLISGLIPLIIFFICACINKYLPYGIELLNSYDSYTQYPGMLLEYARNIKSGYLFYSWNAGLGFNFFGALTYYCLSPLNIISLFANTNNYPYFIAILTYLRIFLLGFTESIYLKHKKVNDLWTIILSCTYALMGYTATYYYNYIWIDSIIMLPLTILSLDKLIDDNKQIYYIITLTITIIINYYIGYMICIFSAIYFIYRIINTKSKNKLNITKNFIISSTLCGLLSTIILIPSYYALKTGKAQLYNTVDYTGYVETFKSTIYMLTTGSYRTNDQSYGPPQIYTSIFVVVLSILYFYNKNIDKKEKITSFIIILFFLLSFTIKSLNYFWQFFQQPIWWQSRFSFLFVFFLILLASKSIMNIDKLSINIISKISIIVIFSILVIIGYMDKYKGISQLENSYKYFLILSILMFIEIILIIDNKNLIKMLILLIFIDLSINTYNSLKNNYRDKTVKVGESIKKDLPKKIKQLNKIDKSFYRMELINEFSSNDGLYFGYHGINYFSSTRNIKVVYMMEKLGFKAADHCHFRLVNYDPAILSIFNIKYLYGNMEYYSEILNNVYENKYPLSLGFTSSNKIKKFKFKSNKIPPTNLEDNINSLLNSLTGKNINLYKVYNNKYFKYENIDIRNSINNLYKVDKSQEAYANYEFISDSDYLIIPSKIESIIIINNKPHSKEKYFVKINKGDHVKIRYVINNNSKSDIYVKLFNIEKYEEAMNILNTDKLNVKTNTKGHILVGNINIKGNNKYLFTTIEYEEGMKIYVDNKLVKPDIIMDSLIGINLSKGKHTIIIDYIPKGLIEGTILSTLGIILTIVYLHLNKKEI